MHVHACTHARTRHAHTGTQARTQARTYLLSVKVVLFLLMEVGDSTEGSLQKCCYLCLLIVFFVSVCALAFVGCLSCWLCCVIIILFLIVCLLNKKLMCCFVAFICVVGVIIIIIVGAC